MSKTHFVIFLFCALFFAMIVGLLYTKKMSFGLSGVINSTSTLVLPVSVEKVTSSPRLRNLNIKDNDLLTSPYQITGEAKLWYFEGSFPVTLFDSNGKEVRIGYASAQGDWMATDFVPFKVTWMTLGEPNTANGTIVLQRDNPTDRRELDENVKISVRFIQNSVSAPGQKMTCVVTGCSGQICAEEETPSDCMYREEYICYQKATCTRQASGECGWTQTKNLLACLGQYE